MSIIQNTLKDQQDVGLRPVGSITIKMLKIFVVLSWDDIVRLGTVSAAGGHNITWNYLKSRGK